MIKALFALTVLMASTHVEAAPSVKATRAPAAQEVSVVVVELTPLENAFAVAVKGGAVYNLENAARMTMSKMNALNNSLDNGTPVKLRIQGREIIDILN